MKEIVDKEAPKEVIGKEVTIETLNRAISEKDAQIEKLTHEVRVLTNSVKSVKGLLHEFIEKL